MRHIASRHAEITEIVLGELEGLVLLLLMLNHPRVVKWLNIVLYYRFVEPKMFDAERMRIGGLMGRLSWREARHRNFFLERDIAKVEREFHGTLRAGAILRQIAGLKHGDLFLRLS